MAKITKAICSYDHNISSAMIAKYDTPIWYLQGWSFPLESNRRILDIIWQLWYWPTRFSLFKKGSRHNSSDWLVGLSSQLAGLLWTLSCAPGNIWSIFYLETFSHYSAPPASCPDVSFWTLVNSSWWWGAWAEDKSKLQSRKTRKCKWLITCGSLRCVDSSISMGGMNGGTS